ncbi:MAG: protein-L-isoaspartate O-methyltransferase, partial [Actinobacteria bacterium]|nr:protein-L-isoaspartate O-methyltransferase [Actinomycetota bacterium]
MDIYEQMRQNMVATQILSRGIKDENVIEAMRQVRREQFMDEELRQFAYDDRPLGIGYAQTISQPYIVALMTELLELKGNESVLEIGTGSGYQTAILSKIAKKVYSVEIIKDLYEKTKNILKNYKNIYLKNGDGYNGWPEYAPYDKIIATAAAQNVPQP